MENTPTQEVYHNSTCRYLGHEWITTTADNFRRCQRHHCHAAKRTPKRRTSSACFQQQPLFCP